MLAGPLSPNSHATAQEPNRKWGRQHDLQNDTVELGALSEIQERETDAYQGA